MKIIHIKDKLEQLNVTVSGIVLGDFDVIGEITAKRLRSREDENYKKYGAFYRSNYERGILIYYMIRQLQLTSMLEIGFGRGYATLCAAKAFYDMGINGNIVSVDPMINEEYLKNIQQVFPHEWFKMIKLIKGTSNDVLPTINEKFGLVYIDGDHSYEGTKSDWEKSHTLSTHAVLFDDYHLPTKDDPGIKCRDAIDKIDFNSLGFGDPELIRMDRRIFLDERGYTDEQVNYGQCLVLRADVKTEEW